MLAHDVRHDLPTLLLQEDSDDLHFAEPALFREEELKVRKLHLSLLSTGLLSGEAYTLATGCGLFGTVLATFTSIAGLYCPSSRTFSSVP